MTKPDLLQDSGHLILATMNFVIHGDSVLMIRRSASKDSAPGTLIGPGGRIETTEDAVSSAVREIKEETGLTVDPSAVSLKAVAFHRAPYKDQTWIVFVNRIELTEPPGALKASSEGQPQWVKIKDLNLETDVFVGSKYYHEHVLTPLPGILYTNLEWHNGKLIRASVTTVPPVLS
jgi:8-oxo-dGTP pyrophosphatase MutT (NUDIX family)